MTTPSYPISINYDRSFQETIEAGNYGYVDERITPESFPFTGEGVVDEEAFLLPFDPTMTTEDAIAAMDAAGFEPGQKVHVEALNLQFPDLFLEFYVFALGSPLIDPSSCSDLPVFPCLLKGVCGRSIRMLRPDAEWINREQVRLIAIRKK